MGRSFSQIREAEQILGGRQNKSLSIDEKPEWGLNPLQQRVLQAADGGGDHRSLPLTGVEVVPRRDDKLWPQATGSHLSQG